MLEDTDLLKMVENTIKASKLQKFTVLVAGKTGVGKSTLLNSVFRGDIASTGKGTPQTKSITKGGFNFEVQHYRLTL